MLSTKIDRYEERVEFNNNDTPLNFFNWIVHSREEAYNYFRNNDRFKGFLPPPHSTCHEYVIGVHEDMKYSVAVFLDMNGELSAKFSAYAELS